jgi:hypothetical protein
MHFQLIVALRDDTPCNGVDSALAVAVNSFSEHYLVYSTEFGTEPGCGEWDWWVVGGRWRGSFTLTPDALSRRQAGTLSIPIDTDFHIGGFPEVQIKYYDLADRLGSMFSVTTAEPDREPLPPHQIDCARLGDIEPESLAVPFYWLDLDGRLHDLDYVPATNVSELRRPIESRLPLSDLEHRQEVNSRRFREWIEALPSDTWLVNVDVHR